MKITQRSLTDRIIRLFVRFEKHQQPCSWCLSFDTEYKSLIPFLVAYSLCFLCVIVGVVNCESYYPILIDTLAQWIRIALAMIDSEIIRFWIEHHVRRTRFRPANIRYASANKGNRNQIEWKWELRTIIELKSVVDVKKPHFIKWTVFICLILNAHKTNLSLVQPNHRNCNAFTLRWLSTLQPYGNVVVI